MKRLFLIALCAAAFAGSGASAYAKIISPGPVPGSTEILLTLSDQQPAVGEDVIGNISSQTIDIDATPIFWYKNGMLLFKGVGAKQADLGPAASGETDIKVVAGTDAASASDSVSFNPSLVSLAWQADTYVPPFYLGKSIFPLQGRVTFVALPFFSRSGSSLGQAADISYSWKKDGEAFADRSGLGKNTFVVNAGLSSQPITVEVTAENVITGESGYAKSVIAPESPSIAFYENNPLFGLMFNEALGPQIRLSGPEISILAAPFGEPTSLIPSASYSWLMNGEPFSESSRLITLRSAAGAVGSSTISLSADTGQPLQSASAGFGISFGSSAEANNPFGQ